MNEKMRFDLGRVVATPGALDALKQSGQSSRQFIKRHLSGDWGKMSNFDQQMNEQALAEGKRIFSAYKLSSGEKLWIITEADRSVTTLLLPDEY